MFLSNLELSRFGKPVPNVASVKPDVVLGYCSPSALKYNMLYIPEMLFCSHGYKNKKGLFVLQ